METKSIVEMIIDNQKNGYLSEDFHLPDEEPDGEIKWAEGALDGIYIYHMAHEPVTDEQRETMDRIFTLVSQDKADEAEEILFELSKDLRAIAAIDELQNVIVTGQERYDGEKLFRFGLRLFVGSDKRELVKYGLSILELFDTEQLEDEFKDLVKLTALCDEFTIFAMFIMLRWENANELLFQLVQRVHGWGKVHVMERIAPDTYEIRQWILHEGVNNDVEPAYSALVCYEKANVSELLKQELTYDEFNSIGRIIEALLDEGPIPGISEIENRGDILNLFLDKSAEYDLVLGDYSIIQDIMDYASYEDSYYPKLTEKCKALLLTEKCEAVVKEAVKEGRGLGLAQLLGYDYQEDYFNYFKEHVMDDYFDVADCFDERYEDAVIEVFRSNLNLQELAKGADVKIPIWEQMNDYLRLDSCLRLLERMPLKGIDFVKAALNSPTLRNRKSALCVIDNWKNTTGLSVEEIDPGLPAILHHLAEIEPEDEVKETVLELIK